MKYNIGLPISHKENEKRRALIPKDIDKISNKECLWIEESYGEILGYSDKDYESKGVNIASRSEVLSKEIICDPKVGDADYLTELHNQTIFGWVHAVQNRDITDKIISRNLTVYAWENMYDRGRHVFWRNNEIAGEAAIIHAYLSNGIFPYNTKAAVLGKGNVARGAIKTLNYLGAEVVQYDKNMEQLLRQELHLYDVVVNAILWDTKRKDHVIYREDLKRMKPNALIIDISCDRNGGVETCIPTTITNPVYVVDGVSHYAVDHTPSLFWKTTSDSLSEIFATYADMLIEGMPNETLFNAMIIKKGSILDKNIIQFQNR